MPIKTKTKRTKQQEESWRFFNGKARDWDNKATGQIVNKVNVIKQRNDYVLKVIKERAATKFLLDVGSGVGDLVCAAARLGIKATGIDIAGGMVDLAHRRAIDEKLGLAQFLVADYFDWHVTDESYDVVAANGFIEYISYEQRDKFLSDAYRILRPGGSLVISARNRLFNVMSANEYSRQEIKAGAMDMLVNEIVALNQTRSLKELLTIDTVELQAEEMQHGHTGIGVTTRYQYTPVQLLKMLEREGFRAEALSPIHIHTGPPSFKNEQPRVHFEIANLLQSYATDNLKLIGSASAFMAHGVKE